eukprot:5509-Heterococcus_DN1.PRE.4
MICAAANVRTSRVWKLRSVLPGQAAFVSRLKEAFETALETIRAGSQQHGLGAAESDKFTLLPATPGYNHDVHAFGEHGLPLKGAYINETRPLCPL